MKTEEKHDYFYCLKNQEMCEKDFLGNTACNCCINQGNCKHCGRKNTSFCAKCTHGESEENNE